MGGSGLGRSVNRPIPILSLGAGPGLGDNPPQVSIVPETVPSQPKPPPGIVHGVSGWKRVLVWPLAMTARVWAMTLRFEMTPADRACYERQETPTAFVLWHNRLFVTAEIFRRYRRGRKIFALVSASKDGAWLDAFFSVAGLHTVRGSSSRFGKEAAIALVDVMKAGHDIGITPDGPRGPCYDFKPGALIVSRRSRTPLLLMGVHYSSAWRLKSWDRFYLPKPFSRVRLTAEMVPPEALDRRDEAAQAIAARLLELNPD